MEQHLKSNLKRPSCYSLEAVSQNGPHVQYTVLFSNSTNNFFGSGFAGSGSGSASVVSEQMSRRWCLASNGDLVNLHTTETDSSILASQGRRHSTGSEHENREFVAMLGSWCGDFDGACFLNGRHPTRFD